MTSVTGGPATSLPTPPKMHGLPLLGNLLEFKRSNVAVFQRAYEELGPVFGIRLGPQMGVVLVGPKYHELFFKEVDARLSVPELYRFVVPMFGEVALAVRDRERRIRHVSLLQSAFQGGRLRQYVGVMRDETAAWLDSLGNAGTFELWTSVESLSLNIAATSLMGAEVRRNINRFRPLLTDLARGMEFILPPNLPLPRFRRRDRARRQLTELIRPILVKRRATPHGRPDFLQTLVDDPALGDADTDETLVGMALCTIFTGYITTAAAMAWALVLLLQHPRYLSTVVEELDAERAASTDEDFPARARLPRLEWALQEAQRLRPVMSHYARYTAEDLQVDGYRIPRGWLTMLCPAVAHRLPEVFTDPERYDPERFSPPRAEDRRHPHAMIPFGGGFYRCPGSAFGTNEIKMSISMLLDRYRLELITRDPQPVFDLGVTRPQAPTSVRYTARRDGPASR
jgi:sterol 14-demethylase